MILQILTTLLIGYIGWCFYTVQVPRGLRKPILVRVIQVFLRIVLNIQTLFSALGLTTRLGMLRSLDKTHPPAKNARIKIKDTTFNEVKVRLYIPKDSEPQGEGRRALVYFHGGGWVCGCPNIYEKRMVNFACDLNLVIVNVDYRKAPEVIFPGPFLDCVAVTKYFLMNAKDFGADPHRVAIVGDSAGGNLAAAVALKLRDEKFSPMVKLQVLIYPCLQALDFSYPSMIQNSMEALPTPTLAWFWSHYISGSDQLVKYFLKNEHTSKEVKDMLCKGDLSHDILDECFKYAPYSGSIQGENETKILEDLEGKLTNPYLCPLVAKDFKDLPNAYVFTAQYDVLRDEGLLYVKRLRKYGVDVVHNHMECGFHTMWDLIGFVPESKLLYDDIVDYLKTRL